MRTETEFITCPVVWFPNRPNATQAEVLLTLPSCFCHSELTATFQELDISFPTNLRLVLCFLLFSSNERAILLPNNIFALHPDNPEEKSSLALIFSRGQDSSSEGPSLAL